MSQLRLPKIWLSIWLFIILTALLFLWAGYSLGERLGLFIGLLVAVGFHVLIFVFGDSKLIQFFKAEKVLGQDPWALQQTIADLAYNLEMEVPALYVFKSPSANAFSTGIPWRANALGLSTGLLEKLSSPEREAVLAFLLVQLRQTDNFTHGVVTMIANTLVGTAQQLDRLWPTNFFFSKKQKPFLLLFAPLGWAVIKFARHAKAYIQTDALASEILGQRQILSDVLWRLQGLAETQPMKVPPCTSHHFIVNPESQNEPYFFAKTHPSMKYRLEKLIGYYPV